MSLASLGLPRGSQDIGFEIFDEQKLGTSSFVQHLNLNRALQGELARTIGQLDKVTVARVHLDVPKKALFKEEQRDPSATIVLKLEKSIELDKLEVKSIVHLVSSAVAGLKPRGVTVIDSKGNLLSRGASEDEDQFWGSSPLEYKGKIEQEMGSRVEEIVAHIVGVGKVVAKVTVELDFKKEEKTEELYDPDKVVVRSEKRVKENRENSDQGASGAPGAQSNAAGTAGKQAATSERARDLINYEIDKVTRHTLRAAGDLKRMSVAVLVDGTYKFEEVDGERIEKYLPRTGEELIKIREMVKNAVGFDASRNDQIEVTNIQFETSVLAEEELQMSFLERYDFIPQFVKYAIILVLAIIMVFFLFRPLVEWVISFHEEERLREIELQQEDVVKSMEEQLVEVRRTIESSTVEYKKKITDLADQAPDLVAAVIRSWISAED